MSQLTNKKIREETEISLELVEILFKMLTSKRKSQTFYVNKVSEKIQKLIDKRVSQTISDTRREVLEEVRVGINNTIIGDEDKVMAIVKVFRVINKLSKLQKNKGEV